MEEIWLSVPGFEALYSVSDQGRVMRHASRVKNGVGFVNLPERIASQVLLDGYRIVGLWQNNVGVQWRVHRLVALAFLGQSDLTIDHINGDKEDNRLSNLRYCTRRANTLFQHADGRVHFVRGERNGKSKLTEDAVRRARLMIANGVSSRLVAESLGVTKGAIQAMREGRTWAHVE